MYDVNFKVVKRREAENAAPQIRDVLLHAFQSYAMDAGLPFNSVGAICETVDEIKADIENKICYVGIYDGRIIATARLEPIEEGRSAYLSRFGVHPDFVSTGIGGKMLKFFEGQMMLHGCERILLDTASRASRTVRFYYNNGYHVIGTDKKYGYIRVKMEKELVDIRAVRKI
ncbi:GNAT family N-acetyltransferase [Treponema sp. R6D11]